MPDISERARVSIYSKLSNKTVIFDQYAVLNRSVEAAVLFLGELWKLQRLGGTTFLLSRHDEQEIRSMAARPSANDAQAKAQVAVRFIDTGLFRLVELDVVDCLAQHLRRGSNAAAVTRQCATAAKLKALPGVRHDSVLTIDNNQCVVISNVAAEVPSAPAFAPVGVARAAAPVQSAPTFASAGVARAAAPVQPAPAFAPAGVARAAVPVQPAPAFAPVGVARAAAPVQSAPTFASAGVARAAVQTPRPRAGVNTIQPYAARRTVTNIPHPASQDAGHVTTLSATPLYSQAPCTGRKLYTTINGQRVKVSLGRQSHVPDVLDAVQGLHCYQITGEADDLVAVVYDAATERDMVRVQHLIDAGPVEGAVLPMASLIIPSIRHSRETFCGFILRLPHGDDGGRPHAAVSRFFDASSRDALCDDESGFDRTAFVRAAINMAGTVERLHQKGIRPVLSMDNMLLGEDMDGHYSGDVFALLVLECEVRLPDGSVIPVAGQAMQTNIAAADAVLCASFQLMMCGITPGEMDLEKDSVATRRFSLLRDGQTNGPGLDAVYRQRFQLSGSTGPWMPAQTPTIAWIRQQAEVYLNRARMRGAERLRAIDPAEGRPEYRSCSICQRQHLRLGQEVFLVPTPTGSGSMLLCRECRSSISGRPA